MWDTFFSGFTIYFYVFEFTVYSLNSVLCRHLAINSLLLFNNLSGHLCIRICIFSSKHKLHLPSKLFRVFDFFKIDYSISGVNPLFFKHHNCFDSAVWCFRCSWEKVNLWFEYLSFHLVEAINRSLFFFLKEILLCKKLHWALH